MKKTLRILGLAIGILLAILAVAAAALYTLFDGAKIKSEITRAVQEKTQRKLDISGELSLSLWPDVGIKLGRLTLSEPNSNTEFLALDSARVAVAVMPLLSKQVEVRAVDVQGLKATLIKKKDGSLNIANLVGSGDEKKVGAGKTVNESAPLHIDVAGIKLANAQLTWRDEKSGSSTALSNLDFSTGHVEADTGKRSLAANAVTFKAKGKSGSDNFELSIDAPKLAITPDKATGESIRLAASLTGTGRKATATASLSGVEGNAEKLSVAKFVLDIDAQSGDSTVKGRLESPLAVNVAAQTMALDKLAGSLDIAHPAMPMKQVKLPLAGALHADMAKQSADLRLDTQFDESKIGLKLGVPKFAPLALVIDLAIDRLNLDKYLPPPVPDAKPAAEGKLDFSALKALNASGNVRIGALQISKMKIANLNAKINAAGGRLDVAPLTLNLYEGSANGSLSLNANGNAVSVKQNLAGININPLMKDLADKDLIEGKGSVALDVTTRGDTVTAMKKALGGAASLSLKDGALKGINLAQSFRDLKGKLGAKQDSTQQAKAGDKTDFSELTASLKIANGVAHNEDLAMKSPFLRMAGAGDIDIGNGQMNYLAKASVVSTTAGQGGKDLDHLKGLTVPVRITGPFDKLSYKIELGNLVADAAKAKVEEKKQEVKQKAEEKVKDKLKGLFKK